MIEDRRRKRLFRYLGIVLNVAEEKFIIERGNSIKERQCWGRLIVQAVDSYGAILKTEELETISHDIEEIKEHLKAKNLW